MGFVILYGVGIHDALRSGASDEELGKLREHGRAVLKQQGDLKAALEKLDAEIERREAKG
ncbi:MAG: DUF1843 domain-containing protein [Sphingomonadales bacterium]|nr:DUF1843 domain-containing protein [Sphingomonadales bacterium]